MKHCTKVLLILEFLSVINRQIISQYFIYVKLKCCIVLESKMYVIADVMHKIELKCVFLQNWINMTAFLLIFALMLNLTDCLCKCLRGFFLFCHLFICIISNVFSFNESSNTNENSSDIHTVQTFQDLRQQGMKTNDALLSPLIIITY